MRNIKHSCIQNTKGTTTLATLPNKDNQIDRAYRADTDSLYEVKSEADGRMDRQTWLDWLEYRKTA